MSRTTSAWFGVLAFTFAMLAGYLSVRFASHTEDWVRLVSDPDSSLGQLLFAGGWLLGGIGTVALCAGNVVLGFVLMRHALTGTRLPRWLEDPKPPDNGPSLYD